MTNKVILIGRLGSDTKTQVAKNKKPYTLFSVATTNSYNNGTEWVDETEWHSIIAWWAIDASKGDTVFVDGELTYYKTGETKTAQIRAKTVKVISESNKTKKVHQNADHEALDPNVEVWEDGLPF
jgi:single stranded DNA-binding protein